ncbi:MAG TPA: VOC family protein [Rhizomicrobium sp.]|jgi:predicted 3-demethylubiquinone-9 3-methyltransferase (glyoxalase superfamily)|nr:VOC family protein [Rhizomicrobium sp.]
MTSIATCLWYDTGAEEAVNLYKSLFKDVTIHAVSYHGKGGHLPEGTVLTIDFTMLGQRFTALNGGPMYKFSEATSIQAIVDTQEDVDRYWEGLTGNGGQEGPCGWCKDKFGLSWQVVPKQLIALLTHTDSDKRMRASQSMMSMKKLDIAALERAAAG